MTNELILYPLGINSKFVDLVIEAYGPCCNLNHPRHFIREANRKEVWIRLPFARRADEVLGIEE